MYALLSEEQTLYLRRLVKGKVVADLGCGDGTLSRLMARWGATTVHGVDKEEKVLPRRNSKKVRWHPSYFNYWSMPKDVELAVVSWPQNSPCLGLTTLAQSVPHLVYIGKNTDGVACGSKEFMRYISERMDLAYLPDRRNVLIHYGSGLRPFPYVYHEEYAGMSDTLEALSYDLGTERYTEKEWATKLLRA